MFNKRDQYEAEGASKEAAESRPSPAPSPRPTPTPASGTTALIGASIHVDGKLRGDEDLVIEGDVKGTVELKNNSVTIGNQGNVQADVYAHSIFVDGHMDGNLVAAEQVVIRKSARVTGSITSPRVSLEDGAHFNGSIDMDAKSDALTKAFSDSKDAGAGAASGPSKASTKPDAKPEAPATSGSGAARSAGQGMNH